MATATRREVTTIEYTLTLTGSEAEMLRSVLAKVAGSPEWSRRGLADDVRESLKGAMNGDGYSYSYQLTDIEGGITFKGTDGS